jgi:DNA-binding NarL/FixJ family response regulator
MRILIVDDNQPVRRALKDLFVSQSSWQVCGEASNGAEALLQAQALQPDAILLDISMPGADGLEVARLLKKEIPRSKIVLMSQNDAELLSAAAIQAGAHGCVDKMNLSLDVLASILNTPSLSNPGCTNP